MGDLCSGVEHTELLSLALPAACQVGPSVLFASGPVTLLPSFSPWCGPLNHRPATAALWGYYTLLL